MSIFFVNPIVTITSLLTFGLFFSILVTHLRLQFIRQFALGTSILVLIAGVLSCLAFDKLNTGFQFSTRFNFISEYNLVLALGADGLSMVFLLLTLFIFPILFLASWNVSKSPKHFVNYLLAMELLIVLAFTTTDLFYFYVFFESLLIPMFILIGVWGARERKIKASYYFFLYTLFGSLFMLFGVLYLYTIVGTTNYSVLFTTQLTEEQQCLVWICFFLAFAVKMPLFPLHIWLPEAHVEAPTVGSMLLASLLLKLGGYGFLRFSLTLLSSGSVTFAATISTCALLGVIFGSLSTLRQIDLKRIIAYSSVAHMNLVMLGIFSNSHQGLEGAIYLMLGHGVVSTALFFAVGVLYDRHHSRFLRYYGGVVSVMPLFATFFFAFTLANMSFPATSNFLGELLIFLGIFTQNSTILLFSTAGIVLSAVYSVWLYNRVVFGTLKTQYTREFTDLTARETFTFGVLLLPMLVLGVSGAFIVDFIHLPVKSLLFSDFDAVFFAGGFALYNSKTANLRSKILRYKHNSGQIANILTLLLVAVLLAIGVIALSHTLQVAIFFGGRIFVSTFLPIATCVAAVGLIVQSSAINSLLLLMLVFISSAMIYLTAGVGYYALVFLLIGQGAVAILFLYVVILLPLHATQSSPRAHNSQVSSIVIGVAGFAYLITELHVSFTQFLTSGLSTMQAAGKGGSSALRYFVNEEANDIMKFITLYGEKSALFILLTLILLSAMIGAIILATSSEANNSRSN